MGNLVLAGSTSGSTTITPTDAVTATVTLPSTGGTLQTSGAGFTTNGVAYASSTSALATGSALTFNGTDLGINNTSPTVVSTAKQIAIKAGTNGDALFVSQNSNGLTTFISGYYGVTAGFDVPVVGSKSSDPLVFITNNTEKMRLTSAGNLGIGTTSPAYGLDVQGSSNTSIRVYSPNYPSLRVHNSSTGTGNSDGLLIEMGGTDALINNYEAGNLKFATNNIEAMRIDSSQIVYINTTSQYNASRFNILTSSGQNGIGLSTPSGSNDAATFYTSTSTFAGRITPSGSSTSYQTSSDYRLKENIQPMTGALDKVKALKPITFDWIADKKASQGFIAHELQEIVPDCVHGSKDEVDADGNPKYQGIDTSFLVATLTSAIQELSTLITAQQSTIQSLTERITALEGART